ncbi:hypothetical protein RJ55_03177 [Drechmeria coniospora]|nr:hypothetical protein RJ55_03177 [Drechmeria coniospora]
MATPGSRPLLRVAVASLPPCEGHAHPPPSPTPTPGHLRKERGASGDWTPSDWLSGIPRPSQRQILSLESAEYDAAGLREWLRACYFRDLTPPVPLWVFHRTGAVLPHRPPTKATAWCTVTRHPTASLSHSQFFLYRRLLPPGAPFALDTYPMPLTFTSTLTARPRCQ